MRKGAIEIYTDDQFIAVVYDGENEVWRSDAMDSPREAVKQLTCRDCRAPHHVRHMGKPMWSKQPVSPE